MPTSQEPPSADTPPGSTSWWQRELRLPPMSRGMHLIDQAVYQALPEIAQCKIGMLQLFLQHTSASLSLNENADPSVRADLENYLNRSVPDGDPAYRHRDEGDDDMPAHIKDSLLGVSLMLPVQNGRLALGTWQGIYLCEHRDYGGARRLMLTLQGMT